MELQGAKEATAKEIEAGLLRDALLLSGASPLKGGGNSADPPSVASVAPAPAPMHLQKRRTSTSLLPDAFAG